MRALLLINLACFAFACTSASKPRFKVENLYPQLSLGEYLVKDSDGQIYSVSRDPNQSPRGLVRFDANSMEFHEIDAEAVDAKDIKFSNGRLFYRRDTQLWTSDNPATLISLPPLKKLIDAACRDQHCTLAVQFADDAYSLVQFDQENKALSRWDAPGPLSIIAAEGASEWMAILSGSDGLKALWFTNSLELSANLPLDPEGESRFVYRYQTESIQYLAYLNERTGELKLASRLLSDRQWRIELVDGKAGETYVGMDLSFFEDAEKPGMIYLDAWKLEPRVARWKNSAWKAETISIQGVTGFYNLFLNKTATELEFFTNAFRAEREGRKKSFDDLLRVRWQLN